MRILSMVPIVPLVTVGSADAADRMAGDGLGCKDRTIAGRLIDMPDTDPAYIEIWAQRACRTSPAVDSALAWRLRSRIATTR
ncbi:hypothetical protein MES5069_530059 [Mesorhizobium escarrei]|uniref:Uncharacterized protein n=1 Tax=Mesorhizobium escarrei TaxID=666018 RepID=A0ABN8KAG1_9HYPH|nr:hypothetical protein MES5069_530059 [Mesorhizobium escarrei]